MFEIYSYEQVRAANDERRERSLVRYERINRTPDETNARMRESEADVVEIAFATGCPEPDQLSA